MAKNNGLNTRAARAGKLIAGLKKHFTDVNAKLTLANAPMSVGDLEKQLQLLIDNRSAVTDAQAAAKAKVEAERAAEPALVALMRAFTAFIRITFGSASDVLADFGLAPPKARTPMTAEQKAVAVERRKATRKARGTTGPKQKQKVKGNVTVSVNVTPNPPANAEGPQQPPAQNAPQK